MLILVISCGTFIFSSILTAVTKKEVCKYGLHPIGFLDDHIEYLINDK